MTTEMIRVLSPGGRFLGRITAREALRMHRQGDGRLLGGSNKREFTAIEVRVGLVATRAPGAAISSTYREPVEAAGTVICAMKRAVGERHDYYLRSWGRV